jgi:hypothetical protein
MQWREIFGEFSHFFVCMDLLKCADYYLLKPTKSRAPCIFNRTWGIRAAISARKQRAKTQWRNYKYTPLNKSIRFAGYQSFLLHAKQFK